MSLRSSNAGLRRPGAAVLPLFALGMVLVAGPADARQPVREGVLRLSGGERVGLLHVPASTPGGAPVLLVPDLGLSPRVYLHRDRGLARALSDGGRQVYVLDWRRTDTGGGLAAIVSRVLPAALQAAGAGGEVDVVGHGYAGTLVLAAAAGEAQGRVGRVVAINTPVELAVPNPVLESVLQRGGALADLALSPRGVRTLELLLMDGGVMAGDLRSAIRRMGLVNLEPRIARELLTWMRTGVLTLEGGMLKERLARYDRPTLLLLPLRDNFAHPEHAAPLRELAPGARVESRQLSRLDLLSEDYSHISVLQGLHAPHEVWSLIRAHLQRRAPVQMAEDALR